MEFGTNLKRVIDDMGIKQNELARRMDMQENYLSRIINNKYNASWATIIKFAEALEISPGTFFANEEEKIKFMLQELPEDMKEFIRNRKNGLWLYLAKDLAGEDLTPDQILKVVKMYKDIVDDTK